MVLNQKIENFSMGHQFLSKFLTGADPSHSLWLSKMIKLKNVKINFFVIKLHESGYWKLWLFSIPRQFSNTLWRIWTWKASTIECSFSKGYQIIQLESNDFHVIYHIHFVYSWRLGNELFFFDISKHALFISLLTGIYRPNIL